MKSIIRRGISVLLCVSLCLCAVGMPVSAEDEVDTGQSNLDAETEAAELEQEVPADSEDGVSDGPERGEDDPLTTEENGPLYSIEDNEAITEDAAFAEQSAPVMEEETALPELTDTEASTADSQLKQLSPLEKKAGIIGVPSAGLLAAPASGTTATALMPSYTGGTLAAGTYYLTTDLTLSSRITVSSGTVNLYLNGYVLKGSGSDSVIYVSGGSTVLNIYDSYADVDPSVSYNPTPYHAYTKSAYLYTVGAASGSSAGSKIYGGVITNGSNTYGGGIYLASGTVNLYAGTIAGNQATSTSTGYGGGGVYVGGGSFQMRGGQIVGNMAAKYGGGVLLRSGTFAMSGSASITGNRANTSSGYGGGVYFYGGTFQVSDSPVISGNVRYNSTACNVYLYNISYKITVAGPLQGGASIGVFTTSARAFTSGYSTFNSGSPTSDYFFSDSASYRVDTHLNEGYLVSASAAAGSYSVNYYSNGSVADAQGIAYGEYGALSFPDVSLDGWTFCGWSESNSSPTLTAHYNGERVTICANVSFYAVYERDVTFYSGLDASVSSTVTQYYCGSSARSVTSPAISIPAGGWTAYGWYKGTDAVYARNVAANSSLTPDAATYYATFYRTVGALDYDANGGSGTMAASELLQYYNSYGTISDEAFCTIPGSCSFTPPDGQNFLIWNTEPDGSGTDYQRTDGLRVPVSYAVTETVTPASLQTLYAQWGVARGLYRAVENGTDVFITDGSPVTLESGAYYLTGDLTAYETLADGFLIVPSGVEAELYLDGYTVDLNGFTTGIYVSGGVVNIYDAYRDSGRVGGRIANVGADSFTNSSAITVSSGTLNLYGGSLSGHRDTAIYIASSGIFNMYGGSIDHNSNTSFGCIWVGGTFNLYCGTISNNRQLTGAVSVNGASRAPYPTFNMYGGLISENIGVGSYQGGGGVSLFTMFGQGYFNMSGGEISNNISFTRGGGVSTYGGSSYSNITLTGGRIVNNAAPISGSVNEYSNDTDGGGGLSLYGQLFLSGNPVVANNYVYDEIIDNGDGTCTLNGPTLNNIENYNDSQRLLHVIGTFTEGASIGLYTDTDGRYYGNGYGYDGGYNDGVLPTAYFHSDNPSYEVSLNGTTDRVYLVPARVFSVTVPATLPVTVNADGTVEVAADAAIVNNSTGDVIISDVSITPAEGWTLDASFDPLRAPVDSRRFSFAVTTASGEALTSQTVSAQQNLPLRYTAAFAARSAPIDDTQIAHVVFTVRWANEENSA